MTGKELCGKWGQCYRDAMGLPAGDFATYDDYAAEKREAWDRLAAWLTMKYGGGSALAEALLAIGGPKPEWPEGVNQYEGIPLWREPKPELAWDRLAQLAARPGWSDELKEFAKEMPPICTCGEGTVKHFPDCPAHDA